MLGPFGFDNFPLPLSDTLWFQSTRTEHTCVTQNRLAVELNKQNDNKHVTPSCHNILYKLITHLINHFTNFTWPDEVKLRRESESIVRLPCMQW